MKPVQIFKGSPYTEGRENTRLFFVSKRPLVSPFLKKPSVLLAELEVHLPALRQQKSYGLKR
jgi:hypothetical protein